MAETIAQDLCMSEPSTQHDLIAREIVDAAFAVHSALGRVYWNPSTSHAFPTDWRHVTSRSSARSSYPYFIATCASMRASAWTWSLTVWLSWRSRRPNGSCRFTKRNF